MPGSPVPNEPRKSGAANGPAIGGEVGSAQAEERKYGDDDHDQTDDVDDGIHGASSSSLSENPVSPHRRFQAVVAVRREL